jgi:hypothetical protein
LEWRITDDDIYRWDRRTRDRQHRIQKIRTPDIHQ